MKKKIRSTYKHASEIGSPKLCRTTKKGRMYPETYGCGLNRKGKFPEKTKPWMTWDGDLNSKSQHEEKMDKGENDETASVTRQIKYNIKYNIIEDDEMDYYCSHLDGYEAWMKKHLNSIDEPQSL